MAKVLVLGASLDGLVAGMSLAKAGWNVTVIEPRSHSGGVLVRGEDPTQSGPLFWGGPLRSALTKQFPELKRIEHRPFSPYLSLIWQGQVKVKMTLDPLGCAESLGDEAGNYRNYRSFVERIRGLADVLFDQIPTPMFSQNPLQMLDLANAGVKFRSLTKSDRRLLMRMASMSVRDFLDEAFQNEDIKTALCVTALHGRFAGPWSPGTALNLLYQELVGPWGFWEGGASTLISALETALRNSGGELRTNCPVERILVRQGRTSGVQLASGEQIAADVVLSSFSVQQTIMELVDEPEVTPSYRRKVSQLKRRGTHTWVSFRCQDGSVPQLLEGRFVIAPNLEGIERSFDDCKYGAISRNLIFEGYVENGQVNLQVSYTPCNSGTADTCQGEREKLKEQIQTQLLEHVPGLQIDQASWWMMTPQDLAEQHQLDHLHHIEHSPAQLFFARPLAQYCRYDTPINDLHLCGGSTHPGGVTSGASGLNAARQLLDQRPDTKRALQRAGEIATTPLGAGLVAGAGLALLGAGVAIGAAARSLLKKPKGTPSEAIPAPTSASAPALNADANPEVAPTQEEVK